MDNFTPEMIEKARSAKTPEELLTMAKEAGMEEITADSAKAYFDLLHPATGEVSDEELANVSGGGCYSNGRLVVTRLTGACDEYRCKFCNRNYADTKRMTKYEMWHGQMHRCGSAGENRTSTLTCGGCKYIDWICELWVCTNPKKRK